MKGLFIQKTEKGFCVTKLKDNAETFDWKEADKYWERPIEGLDLIRVTQLIRRLEEV